MAPIILVVEDDDSLRQFYRQVFRVAGYDVREAADGVTALQRLEEFTPDLILLDILLPGVSGYSLLLDLKFRATTRHIPIVIVTGTEGGFDQLPPECVLRKPVSSDTLLAVVRRCLARSET